MIINIDKYILGNIIHLSYRQSKKLIRKKRQINQSIVIHLL